MSRQRRKERPTITPSWFGAPTQRIATIVGGGGVCVFASVSVCVHACMRACVICIAIYDYNTFTQADNDNN